MDRHYVLVVRTGEAEIRAVENLDSSVFDEVLPIIELTRGRKKTVNNSVSYPFQARFSKIKEKLVGCKVVMDVTSDEKLSSSDTDVFYNYENGYEDWVNFLVELKKEKVFSQIIPSLMMNFEDENYEDNYKKEIESLCNEFGTFLYRCSIEDDGCYDDLSIIKKIIDGRFFYLMIDCGYVAQAMHQNIGEKCMARIVNIRKMFSSESCCIIVCGTSFPNNITELGNESNDTFRNSEVDVYKMAYEKDNSIVYGDYGSVNPIRNDNVVMARGWIPRIDVPLPLEVFYYRQRRPSHVSKYSSTYVEVAKNVMGDSRFPYALKAWGVTMIRQCAKGIPPSSSPSFWISVRMNMHVMQQLKRLNNE